MNRGKYVCAKTESIIKKCRQETRKFVDHDGIGDTSYGSAVTPRNTLVMQSDSSKHNRTGIVGPWYIVY